MSNSLLHPGLLCIRTVPHRTTAEGAYDDTSWPFRRTRRDRRICSGHGARPQSGAVAPSACPGRLLRRQNKVAQDGQGSVSSQRICSPFSTPPSYMPGWQHYISSILFIPCECTEPCPRTLSSSPVLSIMPRSAWILWQWFNISVTRWPWRPRRIYIRRHTWSTSRG